ncbi:histone deacetylase [Candidatus Bathyarchaeota archaeon]|nr:histone deacetylase [Candidatus Bathyarchaeota archaeon]
MRIVFSEKCLEYRWEGHIERPQRIKQAIGALRKKYAFLEPEPISYQDLLTVHTKEYVNRIKNNTPGRYFDGDTPAPKNIYNYALLSAGAALLAAKTHGFSFMRPPGHHAGINGRAMGAPTLGFCYFNNIALAVSKMDLPTLILDIDGHHGNGTQEIFQGYSKVKFISLHLNPTYPGTGLVSQDNCFNYPLSYSTGDILYLKTLEKALNQVNMEKIDLVGISAGFDAHQGDLASLNLSSSCYRKIGRIIKALKKPVFGVLEGGYVGENVTQDALELINGLEEK